VSEHEHRDDAAAYVLGALEPDEVEAFRRHLSGCVVCRDEVMAFQDAVNGLPATAPQYQAPRHLRRRVLSAVREDARRRRRASPGRRAWRPAARPRPAVAIAAAATIALVVLAGVEIAGGSGGTRTLSASVGDAQLRLNGTHADLVVRHLPPPPRGRIYELWVKRGDHPPSPTNTLFSVSSQGTADVGVPGAVSGVSAVMVTAEPAGGTEVPTTSPVVVARLS
jgi:anti-sigma-K factor RskA